MRRESRASASSAVALAGTILVHGVSGAYLFVGVGSGGPPPPPTYRVRLVAAPEPDTESRRAPEAVPRPAEERGAPPARQPKSTVSRATPPAEPDNTPREAAPRTTPNVQPLPGERPSTGNDVATVSTEGQDFPFPEYLQNIVSQILRRWQRPSFATPLEAEVSFFVHRDGSISGLRFVKKSGNFGFDLEAQGAVEEAGRSRAFGGLPAESQPDVLFVRFYFSGVRR